MNLNLQPIGAPILHKDFREAVNDRLSELNAYSVYLTQQLSEIKSAIENLQRSAIDVGTMEFAADHDGAWLQIRTGDDERKIALPLSGDGSSGILDGPDSLDFDEVKRDFKKVKRDIEHLQRTAIDVGTMEFAADHDGAWLQIRAGDNERKIALPLSGSGSSGILDGPDSLELDEVKRDAVRNISIEQNPTTLTLCLHTAGGIKRIPFPVASLTTTGVLKSGASEVSGGNPADGV